MRRCCCSRSTRRRVKLALLGVRLLAGASRVGTGGACELEVVTPTWTGGGVGGICWCCFCWCCCCCWATGAGAGTTARSASESFTMRGGGSRGRPEMLGIGIGREGIAEGTRWLVVSWPACELRPGKSSDAFFCLRGRFVDGDAPGLVAALEVLPERPWGRDWG